MTGYLLSIKPGPVQVYDFQNCYEPEFSNSTGSLRCKNELSKTETKCTRAKIRLLLQRQLAGGAIGSAEEGLRRYELFWENVTRMQARFPVLRLHAVVGYVLEFARVCVSYIVGLLRWRSFPGAIQTAKLAVFWRDARLKRENGECIEQMRVSGCGQAPAYRVQRDDVAQTLVAASSCGSSERERGAAAGLPLPAPRHERPPGVGPLGLDRQPAAVL